MGSEDMTRWRLSPHFLQGCRPLVLGGAGQESWVPPVSLSDADP